MVQALCHEKFYTSGTWSDPARGIYVGWVARDGSFAAKMPLHNESGQATLVFSGEEFPEEGLIASLRARGHSIDSQGAAYLVHRYEEEADFPKGLNGRFHGLLADQASGKVVL